MNAAPKKEESMLVAVSGSREFRIIADKPDIGFYLYVFEGKKCTHDYLQDSEIKAKESAATLFGVSLAGWKSVPYETPA